MSNHNYRTDLYLTLDGVTVEWEARVYFEYHAGYKGDLTDPPEPATVELYNVDIITPGRDSYPLGPPALLDALNNAMQDEMFAFVQALAEEAAEHKAQMRNDD